MNRRRALMMAQKQSGILFQIKDWTFSGGNLNTGIPICETDTDFSVAYDVTTTTNPASGDGSAFRLMRVIDAAGTSYALAMAKNAASDTQFTFRYMDQTPKIGSVAPGRHRFVITHAKNSGSASIKYRKNSGTAESASANATFVATTRTLILGQSTGVNQLPSGTLHELTIYNRVLSASEIDSFLGL